MAAPALAASIAEAAICCGVTGTAGFFAAVSADPVTAHEIITLRCTASSPMSLSAGELTAPRRNGLRDRVGSSSARTLPLIVRCAKPKPGPGTNPNQDSGANQTIPEPLAGGSPVSGASG